ncbi:MAG: hypothetical protein COX51_00795 [Syntrophobacteraceae bacterium CG23_combo_of_CG06-09_8_20_14_all_50_8]|nr:MAG: hypothetical protein COX51_00795 [Syntrophobacteraceae bacterium CG23_combo_of_CG06-09_8_20_14_all_50_8]
MQPILKNKAALRKSLVGFPTSVIAVLYEDHLEIQDKGGRPMMNYRLNQLTDAVKGWGIIRFKVDGQLVVLEFVSTVNKFFCPLGMLLSSGRRIAVQWQEALSQRGVSVKSKIV